MKFFSLVASVLMISGAVIASEPFSNPSGHVNIPSGHISKPGSLSFSYNTAALLEETNNWSTRFVENMSNFGVNYVPFKNLQVGFNSVVNPYGKTLVGGNLHYQLFEETNMPALAFGVSGFGVNSLEAYYGVLSKHITPDVVLTAGLGIGDYYQPNTSSRVFKGLLLGAEKDFGALKVSGELSGKSVNLGLKFQLSDKVRLNAAICEVENFRDNRPAVVSNPRIVFGVTLTESFLNKPLLVDLEEKKGVYPQTNELYLPIVKITKVDTGRKVYEIKVKSNNGVAKMFINNREALTFFPTVKNSNPYMLTATERAVIVKNRIATLLKANAFDHIVVSPVNDYFSGITNGRLVFTVTPADSAGMSMSPSQLANKWAKNLNYLLK